MIHMNERNELLCPKCGESYLHHEIVTVFSRNEDAERVLQTTVTPDGAASGVVRNAGSNNPSSRRDGLTIEFWCEICGAKPVLTFAQHKGNTIVEWADTE